MSDEFCARSATANSSILGPLPTHLEERTRILDGNQKRERGDEKKTPRWVVYWVRTSMRGHDNPALDVAVAQANARGLPVIVYQDLRADGGRPYPSDRHHFFVLQGAGDLHGELESRGIRYALHVQRRGEAASHLESLLDDAALLVVEDLPVYWHRRQSQSVVDSTSMPVLAVDTACVVPVSRVPGSHDRAFRFREAHQPLLADRLHRRYISLEPDIDPVPRCELPFECVDARTGDLAELVASCAIDHSVSPVADTPGGSGAAYNRWRRFRDHDLAQYHRVRNDAARPDGVSRLSAYLHYGQISPFRIAWQCAAVEGDGPEKFLDELITWREFAHHIGRHHQGRPDWSWLPDWARKTLSEHRDDPRHHHYDWERLARGQTADTLWNLAQKSLLAKGELHNNLRMTWGKRLLHWFDDPRQALRVAIDLNDRYGLDGADPNSYLGILWCFGGFDRPFSDPKPVVGQVRPRSTERHAERLDIDAYRAWVQRPTTRPAPRIAVVGAGVAGLSCARVLHDHGIDVDVFDKGRRPGGRASTRQSRQGWAFDHGAQYFTARTESFRRYVEAWKQQGLVASWSPRMVVVGEKEVKDGDTSSTERFVGCPGIDAVCLHLAKPLRTFMGMRLREVVADERRRWRLVFDDEDRAGPFDAVVLTPPAPQVAELVTDAAPGLSKRAQSVSFSPVWALMMALETPAPLDADALFINDGPLSWMARDSAKPGRDAVDEDRETWVIHATAEWSRDHLEEPPEQIQSLLVEAVRRVSARLDASWPEPTFMRAHRWRYARAESPLTERVLTDPDAPGLMICGDWLCGSRIEGAFSSGIAAAGRVLTELAVDAPPQLPPAQRSFTDL